jgi:hypothetical protein
MQKFHTKLLCFLAVVVVLDMLYLLLQLSFRRGFKEIYKVSGFEKQNFDVIIFGNSMELARIHYEDLSINGLSSDKLAVVYDNLSLSFFLSAAYGLVNQKLNMEIVRSLSVIEKSYRNAVPFNNTKVEFFYRPDFYPI